MPVKKTAKKILNKTSDKTAEKPSGSIPKNSMPKNSMPESAPKKRVKKMNIGKVLTILAETFPDHPMDDVTNQDPYRVLIGCLLSLRTKDDVTIPACERLFAKADTPERMLTLTPKEIQDIIFPVGFFRNKSETLLNVSATLLAEFNGEVPNTIDALLTLKGVGRKTANLVMGLGHGLPAICVDIHVHRISNRLGYLVSKNPDDTEFQLRDKLPQAYWPIINWVMVRHGQEICKPIGARCDVCPVASYCARVDVKARKVPAVKGVSKKNSKASIKTPGK